MQTSTEREGRGLFVVFMQPKPSQSVSEFHEWYNKEHGPARMELSWITNGYRFQATDGEKPQWLATYDIENLSFFERPEYTSLREKRSAREARIIDEGLEVLDRRFYRLISDRGPSADGHPPVLLVACIGVEASDVAETNRWFEEEHVDLLSKIPGWQRSRRFILTGPTNDNGLTELLAIHEFNQSNGLGGPEHQAARDTPWRERVFRDLVKQHSRRTFEFFHEFSIPAKSAGT